MESLFEKLNLIVEKIRLNKDNLNFIQIGAYDGVSFNDMANRVLNHNDRGVFVEPNVFIFEDLKRNKSLFSKCDFVDSAVIPTKDFYHDNFHVHKSGGQSSFVKAMLNQDWIELGYESKKVSVLTVNEFIERHIHFDVDVLFLDCEGYDHDIIVEFLKFQEPKAIYFESWNTSHLNSQLHNHVFTTREEIIKILEEKGYECQFEPIEENILSVKIN